MSLWAARKKTIYTGVFLVVLVAFVGVPTFLLLYKAPTCFDGKQNGDERGTDCGGSCVRLCQADFAAPRSLWERFALVVPGVYNVMAYVENPNLSVGAENVPYTFKFYDNTGLPIAERSGVVNIPAGRKFAVFEPSISFGERLPLRTTFQFTAPPEWVAESLDSSIRISDVRSESGERSARVDAVLENTARTALGKTEAIAVVYDPLGNAMTFSRTVIDELVPGRRYPVVFTWPAPFPDTVSRVEIISQPGTGN